ncbi:hypothetical protein ACNI65_06880 [Roseateles sp. So40a]|uniref:hypothetical protein n=1 Tax=Roseateles sp. So40a TaxID=3400226 RepID=UPI003A873451
MTISMRHPLSTLVTGMLSAAFFFWLAAVSAVSGKHAVATLGTAVCFVALGLMALPMVVDYFRARHLLSEDGLDAGRRLSGRVSLKWAEVRRVRFSPTMKWFVLEDAAGAKVRVSTGLSGLPDFARLVLEHVPETALDARTRRLLGEARAGRRPRVWI